MPQKCYIREAARKCSLKPLAVIVTDDTKRQQTDKKLNLQADR